MDTIFISDLRIETIIGIYGWERKVRQTISLDLEMDADIRAAAATDAIEDTLELQGRLQAADRVSSAKAFPAGGNTGRADRRDRARGIQRFPGCGLRLHKPGALRGSRDVGVMIERGSREPA